MLDMSVIQSNAHSESAFVGATCFCRKLNENSIYSCSNRFQTFSGVDGSELACFNDSRGLTLGFETTVTASVNSF